MVKAARRRGTCRCGSATGRGVERAYEYNSAAYPELAQAQALVQQVVQQEEEAFRRTLQRGLQLFAVHVKQLPTGNTQLPGDTVFRLHETYGFPPDLTAL